MRKLSILHGLLAALLISSTAICISACGGSGSSKAVVDDKWIGFKLGKNGDSYVEEHQDDEQVKAFLKAQDILNGIPDMNEKELDQAHEDLTAMGSEFTTYGIWPKISNDIGAAFQNKNSNGTLSTANFTQVYNDFTQLLNESYVKNYKCDDPMNIQADDFISVMEAAGCESTQNVSGSTTEYVFTQNGDKYSSMAVDANNDVIYISFTGSNGKNDVRLFDQTPYDDYTTWMNESLDDRAKASAECSFNGLQGELNLSDTRILNTISSDDLASVVGFLRSLSADDLMEKYKSNNSNVANFVYYLEMKDSIIAVSFNDGRISIDSVNRKDFFEDNYELDVFADEEKKYGSLEEYVSAMNASGQVNYYSESLENYEPPVQESGTESTEASGEVSTESAPNAASTEGSEALDLEWYKNGVSYYSSDTGCTLQFSWLDDGTIQAEFDGVTVYWFNANDAQVSGSSVAYTDGEGHEMDYSAEYQKVTIHDGGQYDGLYAREN